MEKIKTLVEYQQLASRTCPDLGSDIENLIHMNLGITTEIGEFLDCIKKNIAYNKPLDLVNMGEELADICWYVANKARLFFFRTWEDMEATEEHNFGAVRKEYEELFRPMFQQYQINHRAIYSLLALTPDAEDYQVGYTKAEFGGIKDMSVIFEIAEFFGIDMWQALTNNIQKLMVRYPDKFTNEAALNRDLDAERKVLEQDGTTEN